MIGPLDIGTWALLVASLTFLASGVVFAVAWRSRRLAADQPRVEIAFEDSSNDATWHQQAHSVISEAKAIVDLTTPVGDDPYQPSTPILSAVTRRIDRLDQRLHRLTLLPLREDLPGSARLTEAIGDLRRVGTSLGSALEAERSLRLGSAVRPLEEREQSARRITERSAELDLAQMSLAG